MGTPVRTALLLYAFGVLGVFLLVAPWTPIWHQATMKLLPLSIGNWARTGWVRGGISGLGAIDLVLAFQVANELWDVVHAENVARRGSANGPEA